MVFSMAADIPIHAPCGVAPFFLRMMQVFSRFPAFAFSLQAKQRKWNLEFPYYIISLSFGQEAFESFKIFPFLPVISGKIAFFSFLLASQGEQSFIFLASKVQEPSVSPSEHTKTRRARDLLSCPACWVQPLAAVFQPVVFLPPPIRGAGDRRR